MIQKFQAKLDFAQEALKDWNAPEPKKMPTMLQQSQTLWEQHVKAECDGVYEQNISGI